MAIIVSIKPGYGKPISIVILLVTAFKWLNLKSEVVQGMAKIGECKQDPCWVK